MPRNRLDEEPSGRPLAALPHEIKKGGGQMLALGRKRPLTSPRIDVRYFCLAPKSGLSAYGQLRTLAERRLCARSGQSGLVTELPKAVVRCPHYDAGDCDARGQS